MKLPQLLGKRLTTDYLIGGFLTFMKDEEIEVRIRVMMNMDPLASVIGAEKLYESIIPAIQEFAEHKKWRIKLEAMAIMVYFS